MAVRTQVYEGLLWQQVIEEKKLLAGARLPPLLLLVLYNGARRWDAPTKTGELIALLARLGAVALAAPRLAIICWI